MLLENARPVLPPVTGEGELRVHVEGRRQLAVRREPGQGDVDDLVFRHRERAGMLVVGGEHLRPANDHRIRSGDRDDGRAAVVIVHFPHPWHRRRVVESDAHTLSHLDPTGDPAHPTDDVGAMVTAGHDVCHLDDSAVGRPAGDEREAAAVVAPGRRRLGIAGAQTPASVVLITQERPEERGRIESWGAHPVDAALP